MQFGDLLHQLLRRQNVFVAGPQLRHEESFQRYAGAHEEMNRADEPACKILRHLAKGKRAAAKIGCRADCFRRSGDLAPEVQDEALFADAANQKVATRPQYRNCVLPWGFLFLGAAQNFEFGVIAAPY